MIALLIYRSDEICPFAFCLCDTYQQDAEGVLTMHKDDTVTTVVEYGYFHAFKFETDAECNTLVELMQHVALTVKDKM